MSERERLHSLTLNRRRFLVGAAAAAASAVLAACGGGSSPTATTAATKPAGAATTAAGSPTSAASAPTTTGTTPQAAAPTVAAVATSGATPVTVTGIKNPPQGKPQGNKPSELVLVWGTEQLNGASGIDPQTHGGTIAESRLRHIYEPLVKVERDGKTISPVLATAWKRLDDNTVQFTLRQGVKFHNGADFNGKSVQYSIMRPLDPKNNAALRTTYSGIDRVDVVDNYTVNVHTAKPDPALISRMIGFSMVQVEPVWTEANGQGGTMKDANGTGPYKLKSWSPNQDLVVEAFDGYWGTKPPIKNVRMKTITELATRVAAVRSGDVQVAKDMPPEEVDGMNKSGRATARAVQSNRIPFYFIEVRQAPMDNAKVRQAINYAVDWDSIIQGVLLGNGTRVSTVLAPWHVGFDPTLKPYPYDPDKAKQLLKDAGFPNGVDTNIWFLQGRYMKDSEVAQAIAQQLTKVGIRTKPNLMDPTLLSQKDLAKQLDGMNFASWGNWIFDADNTFYPLFSSEVRDTINKGMGQSSRPYGNPQFDAAIASARIELDTAKRNQFYAQAQKILYDDAAALFMYQLTDIYGVDNWVKWEPRFDEMVWAYDMDWNNQ